MSSYSKIFIALPSAHKLHSPLGNGVFTKEANQRAVGSPLRKSYRPRKFRPHLTQGFSVQMGCHRGIANSPNHRFFPTECVQQNLNSITRTAPRAPYGHRRGLCVGIFLRAQNSFFMVGEGLAPPVNPSRKSLP